jgi:hypothetical protein
MKRNQTENSQQIGSNSYPVYPDFYQEKLGAMLFMEIVPFVLIPCSCVIGIFLNWKIIQTIKKNEKKDLKEDFYKYMSANAKFNCLFCLIFGFYPMTSCTWRPSYFFCSQVFTSYFVQYYKIVMMAYFGEVIKMCANITYLMMTLNRYLLIGKEHAPWLVKIAKLEFKWVIRGSFLFSALINIGHGWEYQAVEDLVILQSYNSFYVQSFSGSYSDYPETNRGLSYLIYSIVYFVINFGVFFTLNTGIEVKIVRRMHKELWMKRERLTKMNINKTSSEAVLTCTSLDVDNKSQSSEGKTSEKEDEKKERRVIKMVVFNGIFNFFLRAPDVLFWIGYHNILSILYRDDILFELNKYVPGFFNFIADIGYLTYIITFTTNFIIVYKFNKNFREAIVFFYTTSTKK